MVGFVDAVKANVKSAVCGFIGAGESIDSWFADIGLPGTGGFADAVSGLKKSVCDNPDPYVPPDLTPFPGGQCVGQLYSYTATATSVNNLGQTNNTTVTLGSTNRISGPVTFIGVEETAQDFIVRARNAAGSIRTFRFLSSGTDAIYSKPTTTSVSLSNITVSPVDGCGDPPPNPIPPYVPVTQPIEVTYEDNDNVTVIEQGDITFFKAQVGPFNTIFAPVSISLGGLSFEGKVTLSPEFDFEFGPININVGGGQTDEPLPDPVSPPPPPPEDDSRTIVGVVVSTTAVGPNRATVIDQADCPDLYIPRIASVSFCINVSGGSAWTSPQPVQNTQCFVPCPSLLGASAVRAAPETGFTIEVTPVYGTALQTRV